MGWDCRGIMPWVTLEQLGRNLHYPQSSQALHTKTCLSFSFLSAANSLVLFSWRLEALAFALCCPCEAINTVSLRHFSVTGYTQRWRSEFASDQSSSSLLLSPSAAGAAAESARHYSLLPVSLKTRFSILLGPLVWRDTLQ